MAEKKTAKVEETKVAMAEETKAVVAEVKEEAAKAPAKKAATKKTATTKTTAAKKTTATKKTTEVAKVSEFYIQYTGKEVTKDEIESKVKEAWVAETGKKESSIKSMKIYVKPEENAAYYVINDNNLGRVEL